MSRAVTSSSTHVELFSGIGAFALELGAGYRTVLAVDNDANKNMIYYLNHGRGALKAADIAEITTAHIPGRPDLLTAGFPCVDISGAGRGEGIHGARSGVFWEAVRILRELRDEGRAPRVVVVENVTALYTGRGGRDFAAVVGAFVECGYRWIGATVIDAIDFTAQSRPRIFIIAPDEIPASLVSAKPVDYFSPKSLKKVVAALPPETAARWFWPKLPVPPACDAKLTDILMDSVVWRDRRQTETLLGQLSAISRAAVDQAAATGERAVFAAFMRTRKPAGPQLEIRVDGKAGCLRAAKGGNSRQLVIEVEGARRRTRYLIPWECARLMAIPNSFRMPTGYAGLNAVGDAVCVAVVAHLERHLISPIINSRPAVSSELAFAEQRR